jgi:hypothetical protein
LKDGAENINGLTRSPLIKGKQGEPSFGAASKQDASGS